MKKLLVLLLLISNFSFGQYVSLKQAEHEKSHIGSDIEQEKNMLLNLLNQARENPQTLGKRLDINLSRYKPMQALSSDIELTRYAQWYSEQLLEQAPMFEHSNLDFEESILWNYDVCVSIDQFINSTPHRRHMLDKTNGKIGIGITKGLVGQLYRTYVVILTN